MIIVSLATRVIFLQWCCTTARCARALMISVVCLVWRRVDTLSLSISSMCLRPLSLSLSTRGAPYLVYSVIKGRFLLIHGFNKTRSIGSSAPHSTIIFFSNPPNSSTTSKKTKFALIWQKIRPLVGLEVGESTKLREVNNHLPRFRAETRRGQTGRRWFYKKKIITQNSYYSISLSVLRCVCFFLRIRESERS